MLLSQFSKTNGKRKFQFLKKIVERQRKKSQAVNKTEQQNMVNHVCEFFLICVRHVFDMYGLVFLTR
jgi:hypothetical protein